MTVRRAPLLGAPLLLALAAHGCSSGDDAGPDLVVAGGCQPLLAGTEPDLASDGRCLLPYPSDFYRRPGPPPRITLPDAAKPRRAGGAPADMHAVVAMDGFSLIPTIVATLPSSVVADGLPNILDDPRRSASAGSATVIVDAETGAFVPHYADVVERGVDAAHQPIVLRTFAPLLARRRYVVALRGVRAAADAGPAPAPPGFRRLRDGIADPALAGLAGRFASDVFPVLERAGVPRRELQLAWDFTTGSEEEPRRDMLRVRDLTLAWLAENVPAVTVSSTTEGAGRIWRTVHATLAGPLFLAHAGPGALLARGADGRVQQNGTTTFELTVKVPASVRDGVAPGRALAYGHGFFGGRGELDGAPAVAIADRLGAVLFGIDWWGMTREDIGVVANTIGDAPEHAADFADRVHQAMANWLVTTAAIRSTLATLPELARAGASAPLYDPGFVGYFGASQAHILGGTLAALDPNLTRLVLNVGGGGFTHVMPRSGAFAVFSVVLDATFKDELVTQAFLAMFQRALDRIDPIGYAPLVEARPIAGSPARRVLLQIGLGDIAVPNASSFLHARALGVRQTVPAPSLVFGLEPATDGASSALTLFDYGIDTSLSARPAPLPVNDVHDVLRTNPAALAQMDAFLRPDGTVVHPCDGACDPE